MLDVHTPAEFSKKHAEGALNIPLDEFRARMEELPKDRDIWVYCQVGQRGYYATRALRLNGYRAFNLSGGIKTCKGVRVSAC